MKGGSCEAVSGGNWANERGPCLLSSYLGSLFTGLLLRRISCCAWPSVLGGGGGGGGVNNKVLYGKGGSAPEVQPLTLFFYTIFDRKGTFRIPHINKRYPFTCIVSNFAYLLTAVNALS